MPLGKLRNSPEHSWYISDKLQRDPWKVVAKNEDMKFAFKIPNFCQLAYSWRRRELICVCVNQAYWVSLKRRREAVGVTQRLLHLLFIFFFSFFFFLPPVQKYQGREADTPGAYEVHLRLLVQDLSRKVGIVINFSWPDRTSRRITRIISEGFGKG